MEQQLRELGDYIATALPQEVIGFDVANDELVVTGRTDKIVALLTFLRDDANCKFKLLMDICGVDYPERAPRFDIVYHLLSMHQNQRVRVKVEASEDEPLPTVGGVFSSAGWFEREVWDMYGVMFADHPDLRRLLTDYGFEGHPLRKDFPLTGHVEVRYDDELERVVYEPVSLVQEFRSFDFLSPWESAKYVMPGDEKADAEGSK